MRFQRKARTFVVAGTSSCRSWQFDQHDVRDSPDDLTALVDAAARHYSLPQAFVEKDFWVIEVLRSAMRARTIADKSGEVLPVVAVFKGGTSLSRGFGIIERFSEDVDLLISFPGDCSVKARDRVLKAICSEVGEHLDLDQDHCVLEGSSTGVKRNMRYHFPAAYGAAEITSGVLLEMGTRGGTFPTEGHSIRSLAAEYALQTLGDDESTYEEFTPVHVQVLAPERTLLEKLALVHDAVTRLPEETAQAALLRGGRHFYDIHCLLNDERVRAALTDAGQEG
ncbi:nucleotidyl transferase AbiEii/AbiGii toxin family protein [Arthrobacter sp. 24S4-2]|uniref:nucleotidyl transferase AbiEii/AbiGii toxin family protein n=1 Tax=Arthrobacter sp. 24S4-2 TaxID=2575374 RepID=UPI0010C78624|nr:nucleotidyl transferase AbiEii/AbiGii toxin family protein [Arthrobacter sp. 24S4-2]QCO97327.1 nucleotidyl transferase AbiEii/AbiGii toxin family protein [Arthrobacter sp. 24S4-2]